MTIKKYVAISYCCIFIAIYFSSIAYALLSTHVNEYAEKELMPQTVAMNATSYFMSGMSTFAGGWITVLIAVVLAALVLVIIGSRFMGAAI